MAFHLVWVFLEQLFWSWSGSLPPNRQEVYVHILSALAYSGISLRCCNQSGWVWYSGRKSNLPVESGMTSPLFATF